MAMTLIADNTADTTDLASVSFTSGIDSTYKLYIFKFYEVNPATDAAHFQVEASTNGGSSYGITKTVLYFTSTHTEADGGTGIAHDATYSIYNTTNAATLAHNMDDGADSNGSGELRLFNPSGTTYLKHYSSTANVVFSANGTGLRFSNGCWATTSAINAIKFSMSSGNMDAVISMWGLA